MPQNWKTYKLGDLTSVITKGTTPSTYGFDFETSGINYIRAQSLNYDGTINEQAFSFISNKAHDKLKRSQLQANDILFSMAGAYLGMVGMVKESFCPANTNQAVGIIRINNPSVYPKFVEYALRNPSTVTYVNSQSGQSAQPNINLAEIGNLSFSFPPFQEQIAIASILSALDDKIELNLQMNKTLEEMAMALYKHWFVDFGPFQKGEFVDSELGMIPMGWEVKRIADFGKVICGKTPSTKDINNFTLIGGYPFIKIPDMHGKAFVSETIDKISELGSKLQMKKLLPPRCINVSCIATVGLVTMNEFPSHTNQQINSIIPEKGSYRYYLYISMLMLKERFLNEASGGSATLNMNTSTFSGIEILNPIDETLGNFDILVSTYFEKILQNQNENQTLTALRDTLLPKLISGEVRVKDAEKILTATL